jgi:hypothetical protein
LSNFTKRISTAIGAKELLYCFFKKVWEMITIKKEKIWNIVFKIFGGFPIFFIVTISTFYIHGNVIDRYKNISGINPFEFPYYKVYNFCINWSMVLFLYSIIIYHWRIQVINAT